MKKIVLLIFVILLLLLTINLYSQENNFKVKSNSFSFGLGYGGGSFAGFDFEVMTAKIIGIQAGLGYSPFGEGLTMRYGNTLVLFSFGPSLSLDGSINIHLKPDIQSSYFSILYWYRFGNHSDDGYFVQSIMGASYVYRSPKWFTLQMGLGTPVSEHYAGDPKLFFLFSIGAYIPW